MELLKELVDTNTDFDKLKSDIKNKRCLRGNIALLTKKSNKISAKDDKDQPETGSSDSPDTSQEPSDFDSNFAKQRT